MANILVDHALENIWAEPLQDYQHRVRPNRISPNFGFYKEAPVMWERIPLPDYDTAGAHKGWHVYPIGQVPLQMFALDKMPTQQWFSGLDISTRWNVCVDLYADNGTLLPRDQVYLRMNYDKNLIMAVERNGCNLGKTTIVNAYKEVNEVPYSLDHAKVTVRFYNNAITHTKPWLNAVPRPAQPLSDVIVKIARESDWVRFYDQVKAIEERYQGVGKGLFFQDGFVISRPAGFHSDMAGTILSFQYDETIKDIRFFNIRETPGFVSQIDPNKKKFLLVSNTNQAIMDYYDDCDYYLVTRNDLTETYRGMCIDPYNHTAVRQVTHDAWSVTEDAVDSLIAQHKYLPNKQALTLMVKVRQGGMFRGIGLQANRVEELYHLSYKDRLEAMAGVNSTMKEWRAAELENSAYIRLMGSAYADITQELVEEAYGYNAATYAIAKSIYKVDKGWVTVDGGHNIPWDIRRPTPLSKVAERVCFWYDARGRLITHTTANGTSNKIPVPDSSVPLVKVEVINGALVNGTGDVGTFEDRERVPDPAYGYYGYRNYVCGIINGVIDHRWIDVTNSPFCTYVKPADGGVPYIRWEYKLLDQAGYYPATRFGNRVVVTKPPVREQNFNGVIDIELSKIVEGKSSPIGVPPGFFTVWCDGFSLVENLDYFYRGNGIVIIKTPFTNVDNSEYTIRYHGFMNPTTKRPFAPRDIGFVKNGVLSVNQVFNPWHDRDIRISVGGNLKTSDEVVFAEAGSANTGELYLDGMVYSVEDYQSLMEPFSTESTVDAKMLSLEIDQRVSEYLTTRLPENDPHQQFIQPKQHELYSPVMSFLLNDIRRNLITDEEIDRLETDNDILTRFKPYMDRYGEYDPVVRGYDDEYITVLPHCFSEEPLITSKQYALIEKFNRIFLKGQLNFSMHVLIKP